MHFLKLLKTLNSAQSSWQISLAIVLALISGFLPLATPLSLVILFIAFGINIPLGVYFFLTVFFGGVALVLDPIFAAIGLSVLSAPALENIFTAMYNYTPTLWTSYNYTILMGSLVLSLPLALTLFPILTKIIDKYRDVLEAKFKESRFFSWLNPYTEDKLKAKPGLVRLWAAGLFTGIVAGIIALFLLLLDPAIKYALELSLSKATQRIVQIDSVTSTLLDAKFKIQNISFLSNKKGNNDINIDTILLKLNVDHLLEKKLDFEIISFGNIRLKKNIAQKQEEPKKEMETQKETAHINNSFETPKLPKAKDLIAKEGLKSITAAKEIKENVTQITQKWKDLGVGSEQRKKINSLKVETKALIKKAKKIKNLAEITDILERAQKLKKEAKSFNSEITQLKKEYKEDKKLLTKYAKEIKTLPVQDYKHLLSKYSLDNNGALNIVGTYFSSSLEKYLRIGEEYYNYLKPYISDDNEKEEVPQERMQGEWIHFASTNPYPTFVIRKLDANIIKDDKNYKLNIKDISNDQKLYKKPITGRLTSKSDAYKSFLINFEHNTLQADTLTKLESKIDGYKLNSLQATQKFSIDSALVREEGSIKITNYKDLQANISALFTKTDLLYIGNSRTDKAVQSILSGIHTFMVVSSVGGTLKEPKISLHSDIDKKLKQGLNKQLKKEVQKYKKELKVAINREFKKQVGSLNLGQFADIEKLLNTNAKEGLSLQNLIKKNISKDAMQKQLGSKTLEKFTKGLKLF